ncbi:MAG: hypothetical protein E7Y34_00630, partial [Mycoplasma sp.]|nr:hypothetical protein [Mycoplasma sp.]
MLSRTKNRLRKGLKIFGFLVIPTFLTSILVSGYFVYYKVINRTREIKNIFANIIGLNSDASSQELLLSDGKKKQSHFKNLRDSFRDSRHVTSYKKQIFNNIRNFSFLNTSEDSENKEEYADIMRSFVYGDKDAAKNDPKEIAAALKDSFRYVSPYNSIENIKKIISPEKGSTRLKQIYHFFGEKNGQEEHKHIQLEGKKKFKIFLEAFLRYIKCKYSEKKWSEPINLKKMVNKLKEDLFGKSSELFFKKLLKYYQENNEQKDSKDKKEDDPFIHFFDFNRSIATLLNAIKPLIQKWIGIDLTTFSIHKSIDGIYEKIQALIDYIAKLEKTTSNDKDIWNDPESFKTFSDKLVEKISEILGQLSIFIKNNYKQKQTKNLIV